MFIEEIKIDRYGPISFKKTVSLAPFTLFFGQNEAGKSLTIDALVKFLLGKESSVFYKINRVDEYPNGFIIINFNGKKIKLPEKGNLRGNTDINLETNDFKNIFIVRSSNLDIPDESNFFLEITERLTGIKASVIDKIKGKIREISNLTPGNSFKDTKDIQLKSRIERAIRIIDEIDLLSQELKSQNYDMLIQLLVEKEDKLDEINKRLSDFNNAKFRDEYYRARHALSELKELKNKIENYRVYTEDVRQHWYDLIKDKERIDNEIETDQDSLNNLNNQIKDIKKELNNSNQELMVFNSRMNEVNKILPKVEELENKDADLEKMRVRNTSVYKPLFFISILFLATTTAVTIFTGNIFFVVFGIAFFIFSIIEYFNYPLKKSKLKKLIRYVKNNLARYGVKVDRDEIKDMIYNIRKFEEDYNRKREEVNTYTNDLKVKSSLYRELENKIEKNRKTLNEIRKEIDSLKNVYNVSDYKEYCKKLEEKKELINKQIINQNFLKNIFLQKERDHEDIKGANNDSENLNFWERKVLDLEKYKDLAHGIEYNQIEYESLLKEKEITKEKINELSKKLEELKIRIVAMEKEINSILLTGSDYFHLSKISDFEAAKDLLNKFIESNNKKRRLAILAIQVFDEIKRKKKAEISELFSSGSNISDLFKEISGGKYYEVIYDSDESKINVKDKNGILIDADKLSSGAFDQLFFSIRLALAEKLLGYNQGFFIMDDPFIRSDKQRLIRQLETLNNIIKMGWQIIYFTAKDEVREVLEAHISNVEVNVLEMDKILG